ncbi:hypothetical protein CEXT_377261 [Caerostris extrusa]|uniref:Uncharacterized protein n=1 Tax=Caerostris extrusa TaxID=172846 RepID=A0AAV4VPK7_CAEEX|nr:hypothetical protein CEXT_377261 [Caerostris extrusa]
MPPPGFEPEAWDTKAQSASQLKTRIGETHSDRTENVKGEPTSKAHTPICSSCLMLKTSRDLAVTPTESRRWKLISYCEKKLT